MRRLAIIVAGLSVCVIARAQTYHTARDVVAGGAMDAANASMRLQGTFGQSVVGVTTAADNLSQGFWHNTEAASGVSVSQTGPPADFTLEQNYPNPFTPSTLIRFSLPENAHVVLRIYSLTGALVKTLVDDQLNAGVYSVNFDAADMTAGTYLYTLQTGGQSMTKQMTLIK